MNTLTLTQGAAAQHASDRLRPAPRSRARPDGGARGVPSRRDARRVLPPRRGDSRAAVPRLGAAGRVRRDD